MLQVASFLPPALPSSATPLFPYVQARTMFIPCFLTGLLRKTNKMLEKLFLKSKFSKDASMITFIIFLSVEILLGHLILYY
jgi:hypothetical protein